MGSWGPWAEAGKKPRCSELLLVSLVLLKDTRENQTGMTHQSPFPCFFVPREQAVAVVLPHVRGLESDCHHRTVVMMRWPPRALTGSWGGLETLPGASSTTRAPREPLENQSTLGHPWADDCLINTDFLKRLSVSWL